jgi:hypothetical protein
MPEIKITLQGEQQTDLALLEEFLAIQLANFSLGPRPGKFVNVLTLAKTLRDKNLTFIFESTPTDE